MKKTKELKSGLKIEKFKILNLGNLHLIRGGNGIKVKGGKMAVGLDDGTITDDPMDNPCQDFSRDWGN